MSKNKKRKLIGVCALICALSTTGGLSGCALFNPSSSDSGMDSSTNSVTDSSESPESMEEPPSFEEEDSESSGSEEVENEQIKPLSPAENSTVSLASQAVIDYLKATTAEQQLALLEANKSTGEVAQKVVLSWEGNSSSTYKIFVADNEKFEKATVFETAGMMTSLEVYNLLPGTTYYWKVQGTKAEDESPVWSFTTSDESPVRFIYAGEPLNMRDLGGWQAGDTTVNYGMIYRGGLLNGDDVPSIGRKSLDEEGIAIMRNQLGIQSEVDLRSDSVQTESHLGADIQFLLAATDQYDRILSGASSNAIKQIFEFLANKDNYPVYIHCNAGADRTGTLAFLLNGLLGVSYEDLIKDFEVTSFSYFGERYRSGVENGTFDETGVFQDDNNNYVAFGKLHDDIMEKYSYTGTEKLSDAIENFLIDVIGVDRADLEKIKSIMLKDYTPKQFVELQGNAQDILLENQTASLSLGDIEYDSVLSVRYGRYSLGTNLNEIDLSQLKEDTNVYGERKVIVTVQQGEKITEVFVPVLFITKEISTAEELKSCLRYHNGGVEWGGVVVGGYYRLKNDIMDASLDMMAGIDPTDSWSKGTVGFIGTLDGNGKTITASNIGVGGMFGMIGSGAVIKNCTIKSAYNGVGALLAAGCWGATIEDVTFEITEQTTSLGRPQNDWQGWITQNFCGNTAFKNVAFKAEGYTIDSMFGGMSNGGYFTSNTFENCTLKAVSLGELGHVGGDISSIFVKPDGLVVEMGIQMTQEEPINVSKSEQSFVFGQVLANATVVIQRNEEQSVTGTLDENGCIVFTTANMFSLSDVGAQFLTVTAETPSGDKYVIEFTVTTESGYKQVTVEDGIQREFVLSTNGAVSESVALDLGTYAGGSVISVKLGTHDLGTDVSALNISAVSEDMSVHGKQTVTVLLQKDGKNYELNYSVLVITGSFTDFNALKSAVGITGDNPVLGEGAYYVLGGDIDAGEGEYAAGEWGGLHGSTGFKGTLDGCGYTIHGGKVTGVGLFGGLYKATIKNINFTNVAFSDGQSCALFGTHGAESTLENINVTLKENVVMNDLAGVFFVQGSQKTTAENVTVTAVGGRLTSLFGYVDGQHSDAYYNNVTVKASSLAMVNGSSVSDSGVRVVKLVNTTGIVNTSKNSTITLGGTAGEEVTVAGAGTLTKTLDEKGDLVLTVEDMATLFNGASNITITVTGATIEATVEVTASDSEELAAITEVQYLEVARDDDNPDKTLDLKDYAAYAITKVTLNGEEIAVSGNDLDLSGVTAYGAQTLAVYLEKEGLKYRANYAVIIATKAITTYDSLVAAVYNGGAGNAGAGAYYTLGGDIDATGKDWNVGWVDAGAGFAGTLDGCGRSINNVTAGKWGVFSAISGGTVKNIVFNNVTYGDEGHLLANTMANVTVENVTVNLAGNAAEVFTNRTMVGTFRNVTIKGENLTIGALFGGNVFSGTITAENVSVKAASLNYVYGTTERIDGVTFVKAIRIATAVTTTRETTIVLSGTAGEEVTVAGAGTLAKTLDEKGDLVLTVEDMATLFNGASNITITVTGATIEATVAVTASDSEELAAITEVQYLEVARDDGNPDKTLDLKDYAAYTITKVTLNGEEIAVSGNELDLSGVTAYGAQTLTVYLEKEGLKYRANYAVIIASKAFTNYTQLKKAVMGSTIADFGKGEYYILANDMNADYYYYWNDGTSDLWSEWIDAGNAFMGTLDGCGHTINGGTAASGYCGLFAMLNGAVVKNINFTNVTFENGAALFGSFIQSSTLENINVSFVDNNADQTGSGVFAIQGARNCTIKNVTVTAKGCQLYSIFGTVDNGVHNAGTTYENVVVRAESLTMVCGGKVTADGVTFVENV